MEPILQELSPFARMNIPVPHPALKLLKIVDIINTHFDDIPVQYLLDENNNLWITPTELGKALGYSNPSSSINRIIFRHMNLLFNSTILIKLASKGRPHITRIINEEGVNIICLKSNLPLANDFMEWAKDLSKKIKEEKQVDEKQELQKTGILKKQFNDTPVEYILDKEGNPWITAEQLGEALGYAEPRKGIMKIIERHSELLSEFTGVVKLTTPGHGHQIATIINEHGADIICMKSNTPKAKEYIKWAAKIIADYRHGRLQPVQEVQPARLQQVSVVIDAEFIRLMGESYTKDYLEKVLKDRDTRVSIA